MTGARQSGRGRWSYLASKHFPPTQQSGRPSGANPPKFRPKAVGSALHRYIAHATPLTLEFARWRLPATMPAVRG